MGIDILILSLVYVIASIIGFLYGRKNKKIELDGAYLEGYKKGSDDVVDFVSKKLKK